MNRTDAPAKQSKPFAINGQREDILPTTPAGDNTASYESGFPPITMILKSAGGLPPKGQDMNQILFELSSLGRWSSTGALNTYDSSFATAIGGYPSGAFVLGNDLKTVYRCTTDGNTANPNSVTTGWAKVAQDVADILSLGTAAYRAVGIGTNQIPDMSFFSLSMGQNGYQKLPSGMILQWGVIALDSSGNAQANLPIAFPNSIHGGIGSEANPTGWASNSCVVAAFDVSQSTKTVATVRARVITGTSGPSASTATLSVRYICWGY